MPFAIYVSQATTVATWPSPNPWLTYSSRPPADGNLAPSLANEYPCSAAIPPASRNDSQTAAPATSPAAPSSEKIPAPTIAATPMKAACCVLMKRLAGASLIRLGSDHLDDGRRRRGRLRMLWRAAGEHDQRDDRGREEDGDDPAQWSVHAGSLPQIGS